LPNPHSKDEKSAARHIEEATFGVELPGRSGVQFPNRDINRLIRATDFLPEGEIRVAFVNMSAHRVESRSAGKGASIPIWCEAIEAGSRFRGTITVEAASELWNAMNSTGQAKMNDLFGTWKEAGRRLLEAERETWASARGPIPDSVRQFFDDALGDGGHYAVLGWGGGWRSKTLGTLISTASLAKIARQYNLRRWQGRDFPDRFPVTRKLAYSTDGLRPPGWVQVSVQKEAT
jgi:CRISPR type III-A-associated RAMP protein Csm5